LARALHALSDGAGSFVAVNCAAIPRDLFESELFGHARGAFSGAGSEKAGLLEQAADGTLLLDEIGEMPRELQAKLLRFLDDGMVRRIGEVRERRVRLKIVAATNRPLQREVAEGLFRGDLFHRLAVHHLEIKPLRLRRGDVEPLARHILRQENLGDHLSLSATLLAELEARPWPGNVRELRNELIRRAMQSHRTAPMDASAPEPEPASLRESRRLHERQRIEAALAEAQNLTAAARHLGMHVTTLRRKMRSLRIQRPA
jgi:transcriptional regulator with PAS, ATPase and Fis domain